MSYEAHKAGQKKARYDHACRRIRIESDAAAKVLVSSLLDGYEPGEHLLRFNPELCLVETGQMSAAGVIESAVDVLTEIDHRFSINRHDCRLSEGRTAGSVILDLFDRMLKEEDEEILYVDIIDNLASCLHCPEAVRLFKAFLETEESCCRTLIYLFDEAGYALFKESIGLSLGVHTIWLHRLPGEIDFTHEAQEHSLERTNRIKVSSEIFTGCGQALLNRARQQAERSEEKTLAFDEILLAAVEGVESGRALQEILNLSAERLSWLRGDACERRQNVALAGDIWFDNSAEQVIREAIKLASASGYPDPRHPGLVSAFHMIGALSLVEKAMRKLGTNRAADFPAVVDKIADWYYRNKVSPFISSGHNIYCAFGQVQGKQRDMIGKIFGQVEALQMLSDALCLAELKNKERNNREGVHAFLFFVGPRGAGKVHLAELLAEAGDRPVRHVDLSLYQEDRLLDCLPSGKIKAGTVLVFENPGAAHRNVMNQVRRLVEEGRIWDEKRGQEVVLKGFIVIFTVPMDLSSEYKVAGASNAVEAYDRGAVLRAMQTERDPAGSFPLVGPPLFSLAGKDRLVIFNRLNVEGLLNICGARLTEYTGTVDKHALKRVTYDPLLPFVLICAEGGKPNPRAISVAVEMLIGPELRKFVDAKADNSAKYLLLSHDRLHFALEEEQSMDPCAAALFRTDRRARVLLLTGRSQANLFRSSFPHIDWCVVEGADAYAAAAESGGYDFALLDPWAGQGEKAAGRRKPLNYCTRNFLDDGVERHFSLLGSDLFGEALLKVMNDLSAGLPQVFLLRSGALSGAALRKEEEETGYYLEAEEELRKIREQYGNKYPLGPDGLRYDLFLECLASVKVRGMIKTALEIDEQTVKPTVEKSFTACIDEVHQRLHRERTAETLSEKGQRLIYDTAWEVNNYANMVTVRLKNLRLWKGAKIN